MGAMRRAEGPDLTDERAVRDDHLQVQARALGDPSRHRTFRLVAEAEAPPTVAELADAVGLHPNAIRQHLAKLVDAGLVVPVRTPAAGRGGGRGRPPVRYVAAPDLDERWGEAGPYERLALLLAEVIRTGDAPIEVGRRHAASPLPPHPPTVAGGRPASGVVGRGGGEPADDRPVDGRPVDDPVEALVAEMARLGFDPVIREASHGEDADGTRVDISLRSCPFERVAVADPGTVCALHQGLAEGFAAPLDGVVVERLVARDPRRADCHLLARRTPPPPGG